MSDDTLLAQEFERHRPHLRAVAYRMLGSTSEADDAVQEAWLRLSRSDADAVENMGGWLTTVVGRISLDMLRQRKARAEESPDDHLLSRSSAIDPEDNPAEEAELADSIGLAMLVVLENLSPAERVAFVLHDMFGVPFSEIAEVTGRAPDAARQLASRARSRVRGSVPPPTSTWRSSAAWWTRSSPPPGPETSRPCSRYSTPTSSSVGQGWMVPTSDERTVSRNISRTAVDSEHVRTLPGTEYGLSRSGRHA